MLDRKTFWRKSRFSGDLVTVCDGDEHRASVMLNEHDFPMNVEKVAALMNDAFRLGMEAKALEVRKSLGM